MLFLMIIFFALISLLLISPKWSCFLIGLAVGGFPGAALGFAIGYLLELIGRLVFSNRQSEGGSFHQYTYGPFWGQNNSQDDTSGEQGANSSAQWESFWEQFTRQQQQYGQGYGQGYGQSYGRQTRASLDWAYNELGISESATDDELKSTYRKLALKYHPDMVATQGEEAQKRAQDKFKKINEAYNAIKASRGID